MKFSDSFPYLVIIGLLIFILLSNKGCIGGKSSNPEEIKRDTVIKYIHVTDTIVKTKIVPIKTKKDTIWIKSPENKPDTTYEGLLKQYNFLGNKHFESKFYSNTFKIKDYGTVTLNDTIKANELIYSSLVSNLLIPEKTITIEKKIPYRQLYIGLEALGNSDSPINGAFASGIFKTKKDNLYGLAIGYQKYPDMKNGQVVYKASLHWPIK